MSALSDANEAEKSADHIFTTWQDEAAKQKREAVITHLKNRDGKTVQPFAVYVDAPGRFVGNLRIDNAEADQVLQDI